MFITVGAFPWTRLGQWFVCDGYESPAPCSSGGTGSQLGNEAISLVIRKKNCPEPRFTDHEPGCSSLAAGHPNWSYFQKGRLHLATTSPSARPV